MMNVMEQILEAPELALDVALQDAALFNTALFEQYEPANDAGPLSTGDTCENLYAMPG